MASSKSYRRSKPFQKISLKFSKSRHLRNPAFLDKYFKKKFNIINHRVILKFNPVCK